MSSRYSKLPFYLACAKVSVGEGTLACVQCHPVYADSTCGNVGLHQHRFATSLLVGLLCLSCFDHCNNGCSSPFALEKVLTKVRFAFRGTVLISQLCSCYLLIASSPHAHPDRIVFHCSIHFQMLCSDMGSLAVWRKTPTSTSTRSKEGWGKNLALASFCHLPNSVAT